MGRVPSQRVWRAASIPGAPRSLCLVLPLQVRRHSGTRSTPANCLHPFQAHWALLLQLTCAFAFDRLSHQRSCTGQFIDGSKADACCVIDSRSNDLSRHRCSSVVYANRNNSAGSKCVTPTAPTGSIIPITWQKFGATGFFWPNNYAPVCADGRREAYIGVACKNCPSWHLAPFGFWQWPTAIGAQGSYSNGSWVEVIRFEEALEGPQLEEGSFTNMYSSTWWYVAPGSGTWLNVGRTCIDALGCGPPSWWHAGDWRQRWRKWAVYNGYDTIQFILPTALHGHEIVDLRVADAKNCRAARYLRGGVAANRPCRCDPSLGFLTRCLGSD